VNDRQFERTIQITKIALLAALLALGSHAYLGSPKGRPKMAEAGFTYTHIVAATNTLIKGAPGTLHNVTINGGTAGLISLFDTAAANCSGGITIGIAAATVPLGTSLNYDLQFNTGLCITTAAATDLTVTVR
jgi:hypothetical protein